MKNKKENELLREIVPILIKYDLNTIVNCVEYIMENKQQLSSLLTLLMERDLSKPIGLKVR